MVIRSSFISHLVLDIFKIYAICIWRQEVYIFLENQVYLWDYSTKSLETLHIEHFEHVTSLNQNPDAKVVYYLECLDICISHKSKYLKNDVIIFSNHFSSIFRISYAF